MFLLVVIITGFHVGYTMAYTNQTANTLNAKFGWDDNQKTLYQSMIGSFAVGSMMVGSTLGGRLIAKGRLKILVFAAFIGIIGVTFTLLLLPDNLGLSLYFILAGRLVYGFSTGLIAVAMPRYMDEVLPSVLFGLYGGIYCFSFAIATLIAYLLALGLP
jgi:MFS family permease